MLSSIMPQYTAAKRKVAKISRMQIPRTLRRDHPSSPKSFVSPELADINSPSSEIPPVPSYPRVSTESEVPVEEDLEQSEEDVAKSTETTPRVQFEISPGSLSDWSDLFSSEKFNFAAESLGLLRNEMGRMADPLANNTITSESKVTDAVNMTTMNPKGAVESRNGEQEVVTTNGHLPPVSNVEAMSEVVGNQEPSTSSDTNEQEDPLRGASFWKPYPSPLQIPDGGLDEMEFQRTLGGYSLMDSFPRSAVSDSLSPVTGATLARALIGNPFHLSNDSSQSHNAARHGFNITRMDSSVLPPGETAQLSMTDGQNLPLRSGSKPVFSSESDMHSQIPPVPPLPSHLVSRDDRSAAPHERDLKFSSSLDPREPNSTSSITSFLDSYIDSSSSTPKYLPEHQLGNMDVQILRRISRITEAPSGGFTSIPSTPPVLGVPPHSANSSTFSIPTEKASSSTATNSGSSSPALLAGYPQSSTPPRQHTISESHLSFTSTVKEGKGNVLGDSDFAGSSRNLNFSPPTSDSGSISSRAESPYMGQRNDQWDPRKWPKGKAGLGLTLSPSPNGQGGKVDWLLTRNRSGSLGGETYPSRSVALLPIGDRPRSFLNSVPSNDSRSNNSSAVKPPASSISTESSKQNGQPATSNKTPAPVSETAATRLVPTSTRNVFNRQRAGSTPSPITVDRVSKDLDSYHITVAGDTPGLTGPMFPETPQEFSPMWSAGSISSPLRAEVNQLLSTVSPTDITRSTSFNAGGSLASLAQQVLISRAATSVRGARAGNNVSRPRITAPSHPYARSIPLLTPPPEDPFGEDSQVSPEQIRKDSPTEVELTRFEFPSYPKSSDGAKSLVVPEEPPSRNQDVANANNITGASGSTDASNSLSVSSDNLPGNLQLEGLSVGKPLPPRPEVTPSESSAGSRPSWTSFSEQNRADISIPSSDSNALPVQNQIPTDSPHTTPPPVAIATPPATSSPTPPPASLQPSVSSPTPSQPPSSSILPNSGRSEISNSYLTHSFTLSLGAPPPYYSIVPEIGNGVTDLDPPFSRGSDNSSPSYSEFRSPPAEASPSHMDNVLSPGESSSSRNNRGARMRPRLPAGPRNPTSHSAVTQHVDHAHPPGSSGSGSNVVNGRHAGSSNASSFVPKFQSPPMKWRGYTMDAAKWTFTSTQLQAIVSRAIRQSAEAYSIRLLRLETLDNDLPDEMHRLEMLGTDVKARYKALSRKRHALLLSLSAQMKGTAKGDPVASQNLVDELAEVSEMLDRLAEELHSVDEQTANLRSLRDVHSASALAMALRKLNASFLRQLAEMQALRQQLEILEGERDEAWKHAEDVAHDFDNFTEKVFETSALQLPMSARISNRRSSRVMAVRKSSVRALKAGLHPSRSQRSSVSSAYRSSLSPLASSKNVLTADDLIPPVPPIPLPMPLGIETDNLPSRSSMGVSTGTPSSETRAMVKAQEELYALLGISPVETAGLRRRHLSMSNPYGPTDLSPSSPANEAGDRIQVRRPSYRPRSAGSAVLTL